MKNKKGFTLTELLVVIVLLSILLGLTIGSVMMVRNNTSKKEREEQIMLIEGATIFYAQDKKITNGSVTISELLSEGYLTPTITKGNGSCTDDNGCIIDPVSKEVINSKTILISKENNKLTAEYQE